MASATQNRAFTSAPSDGSRTLTTHDVQPRSDDDLSDGPSSSQSQPVGALRLRGGPRRIRQRVAWDDGVVDNEGAGKKKSKSTSILTSHIDYRTKQLFVRLLKYVAYTTNRRGLTNHPTKTRLIQIWNLVVVMAVITNTLMDNPDEDQGRKRKGAVCVRKGVWFMS